MVEAPVAALPRLAAVDVVPAVQEPETPREALRLYFLSPCFSKEPGRGREEQRRRPGTVLTTRTAISISTLATFVLRGHHGAPRSHFTMKWKEGSGSASSSLSDCSCRRLLALLAASVISSLPLPPPAPRMSAAYRFKVDPQLSTGTCGRIWQTQQRHC